MDSLTEDLLRAILLPLTVQDLCNVAKTCRRFRDLVAEEFGSLWEAQCQRWLDECATRWQQPRASASTVLRALRLQGYRSMMRGVVSKLQRHSPVGLWWMSGDMDSPLRKSVTKGLLVVGITDQSASSGPPLHCLTAHSPEWFKAPDGRYQFTQKHLFTINLAPELDNNNEPLAGTAAAAAGAAGAPAAGGSRTAGAASSGAAGGAGPSTAVEAPAATGTVTDAGSSSPRMDEAGYEELDEYGVVVPCLELRQPLLQLFQEELNTRRNLNLHLNHNGNMQAPWLQHPQQPPAQYPPVQYPPVQQPQPGQALPPQQPAGQQLQPAQDQLPQLPLLPLLPAPPGQLLGFPQQVMQPGQMPLPLQLLPLPPVAAQQVEQLEDEDEDEEINDQPAVVAGVAGLPAEHGSESGQASAAPAAGSGGSLAGSSRGDHAATAGASGSELAAAGQQPQQPAAEGASGSSGSLAAVVAATAAAGPAAARQQQGPLQLDRTATHVRPRASRRQASASRAGSNQSSSGPEFSASVSFEDEGRCMVLQVTVTWAERAFLTRTSSADRLPRLFLKRNMAVTTLTCNKCYEFRYHRVVGLPSAAAAPPPLPAPNSFPGSTDIWAQLPGLEGLWTAQYGSHGPEVLQFRMHMGTLPSEANQTNAVQKPTLAALKLVGDPNVPSGQLSFVADLSRCRAGRYDHIDMATGLDDERPVLSFGSAGLSLIDLTARPVALRFVGIGQINESPREWDPDWEDMEMILYDTQPGRLDTQRLSLLWRERFEQHLQIRDFMPFPLRCHSSWVPAAKEDKPTAFLTHL